MISIALEQIQSDQTVLSEEMRGRITGLGGAGSEDGSTPVRVAMR